MLMTYILLAIILFLALLLTISQYGLSHAVHELRGMVRDLSDQDGRDV